MNISPIDSKKVRLSGYFEINLNKYQMKSRRDGGRNPTIWASTITHELLHNMGHMHYKEKYDDGWHNTNRISRQGHPSQ